MQTFRLIAWENDTSGARSIREIMEVDLENPWQKSKPHLLYAKYANILAKMTYGFGDDVYWKLEIIAEDQHGHHYQFDARPGVMKSPLKFYKWTVDVAGQRVEEIESPTPITRQEAEQAAQLIRQSFAALTDDFLVTTTEL